MRKTPLTILAVLLAASFGWLGGCDSPQDASSDGQDLTTREQTPDLNDPYGGYNLKDEAPAFGDATLLSEAREDPEYPDPFAADPMVQRRMRMEHHPLFLLITWGNLHHDSTIAHLTDWSGSLSIDPGALCLKRVIRFEETDRIIPRVSPDLIEWESTTGPGFDGILVRVIPVPTVTAADSSIDSSLTVITFDTAPVKKEYTLAELPGLHEVITLADGNAVAFNAVALPILCPHGFARGAWRDHPERPGGEFFGRWETADGTVRGLMRGIYGVNDEGVKVFYGKMIDLSGRFEGIMRGRWGDGLEAVPGGWFAGHWVDRNLQIRGGIKGEWRRSERCDGGFFRAVWAMDCRDQL